MVTNPPDKSLLDIALHILKHGISLGISPWIISPANQAHTAREHYDSLLLSLQIMRALWYAKETTKAQRGRHTLVTI